MRILCHTSSALMMTGGEGEMYFDKHFNNYIINIIMGLVRMNIPARRTAKSLLKVDCGRGGVYACVRSNVVVVRRGFFFFFCDAPTCWPRIHCCRRGDGGFITRGGASSAAAVLLRGGFFPPCCNTSHRKDPTHRRRATRRVRHVAKTTSTVLRCFCAGFSYIVFFPVYTHGAFVRARALARTERIVIRCVPPASRP